MAKFNELTCIFQLEFRNTIILATSPLNLVSGLKCVSSAVMVSVFIQWQLNEQYYLYLVSVVELSKYICCTFKDLKMSKKCPLGVSKVQYLMLRERQSRCL